MIVQQHAHRLTEDAKETPEHHIAHLEENKLVLVNQQFMDVQEHYKHRTQHISLQEYQLVHQDAEESVETDCINKIICI